MVSSLFIRKAVMGSLIVVIAALVAFPAMAAQGQGTGPGSGPCAGDIAKFCKDVQPGHGRILKCLKGHENELSPDCKSKMGSLGGRM